MPSDQPELRRTSCSEVPARLMSVVGYVLKPAASRKIPRFARYSRIIAEVQLMSPCHRGSAVSRYVVVQRC